MGELTKAKIKFIHSLSQKKYRDEEGFFVAEGTKVILEFNGKIQCKFLLATKTWLDKFSVEAEEVFEVTDNELKSVSFLTTPPDVIGVFYKPAVIDVTLHDLKSDIVLMLDSVQDPGNLGTIIRLADWFGIKNIICSHTTVDAYNPKTIQSTMGALCRVNILYDNLERFITIANQNNVPIYGTLLEGENIYHAKLSRYGIIILGNEGNGITSDILRKVDVPLTIPSFSKSGSNVESLNVAVAAGIVCSEFRRGL